MKNKSIKLFSLIIGLTASFYACKKDEDMVKKPETPSNEEEVITTLSLILQDSANLSMVKTFTFRDPDGNGGNAHSQFDTIRLDSNKTYFANIVLLNETASPFDTISNEVLEEGVDHLFCFDTKLNLSITKTDLDKKGLAIGLSSKWKTGSAGNGNVTVSLKHQPGIKDGSCDKGDADIEINFPAVIK